MNVLCAGYTLLMAANMRVRCAIAGGGPAGIMLGYLLARSGVEVAVLEMWPDFFRDFRGDTIHPSTMEVLKELGLLEKFLKLPHDETKELEADIGDESVVVADFSHLPTHAKFIALMPQWDFLNFIAEEGKQYPGFHLLMDTKATGLIEENGRVAGLTAADKDGAFEIRADLTVGADGRHSTVRAASGLPLREFGAPIDVLWMRISRRPDDIKRTLGRFRDGRILVMIERGDYWQCAYVLRKGGIDELKAAGLEAFQDAVRDVAPFLGERVREIDTWDKVKLLTVAVDCLSLWHREGLLCIGDAAHAMSPIGGVGVNLAVQDAVAAANVLAPAFARGVPAARDLARIQKRRMWPTRLTQRAQVLIQDKILSRALGARGPARLPWQLRLLKRLPYLLRFPARFVGMGARPEHVHTRAA